MSRVFKRSPTGRYVYDTGRPVGGEDMLVVDELVLPPEVAEQPCHRQGAMADANGYL